MFRTIAGVLLAAVTGVVLVAPVAASASAAEGRVGGISPTAYSDCGQWEFGAWDHTGGGGYGFCWGRTTISCGEALDLLTVPYPPDGGRWRDRIESIQNKTSATMALDNWNSATGRWDRLWTAPPYPASGSWGDLPPSIRNQADRIIRVC